MIRPLIAGRIGIHEPNKNRQKLELKSLDKKTKSDHLINMHSIAPLEQCSKSTPQKIFHDEDKDLISFPSVPHIYSICKHSEA